MHEYLLAGLWGLVAGSGLLVGALIADLFFGKLSHRVIAAVMGFGGGVLIAVVAGELLGDAIHRGVGVSAMIGLLAGAGMFSGINWYLAKGGARNRKRCGECVEQPKEEEQRGSGVAIAVGSVLDGVPEALVIGVTVAGGGKIGLSVIAGFFLANVPQGLSSASGMKFAGRSRRYIFTIWAGIPLLGGVTAAVGNLLLGSATAQGPVILAFAAGAVLSMLAEAMIPEAFENAQAFIGLITVTGLLTLYLISH
ncbi:ZIP family metal transporter [Streptomyces sp. NPDC020965]|uniref:ZIP family metal transporter n=1 Tax=Streptomyces sp. NPDC020965 TaxID=3365105 RepID=UPI00378E6365